MPPIHKVTIIGTGAIGASWAALFCARGLDVVAFDINPAAETTLRSLARDAAPVLASLGQLLVPESRLAEIPFTTDLATALAGADFVQENGPERLESKQALLREVTALVRRDTIIATSSSGLRCSDVQAGLDDEHGPDRVVVGHPFNPPHLIPLVEVVGGSSTSEETVARTLRFYEERAGKRAIRVRREMPGHIANRLQGALMREVLYMVQEGAATVADVDAAMAYGPGLRWGVMGPSLLFHLGGGEGGARHFADHLLGATRTWHAPKDPVIDEALKDRWVEQTAEMVAGRGYRELARQRDEEIVRLLNVRREWDEYAFREREEKEKEKSSA